jgi:hypothetical protein
MRIRADRQPMAARPQGALRAAPRGRTQPPLPALVRRVGNARAGRMLMRHPPKAYIHAASKEKKPKYGDIQAYLDAPVQRLGKTFGAWKDEAVTAAAAEWERVRGQQVWDEFLQAFGEGRIDEAIELLQET